MISGKVLRVEGARTRTYRRYYQLPHSLLKFAGDTSEANLLVVVDELGSTAPLANVRVVLSEMRPVARL